MKHTNTSSRRHTGSPPAFMGLHKNKIITSVTSSVDVGMSSSCSAAIATSALTGTAG